MGRGSSGNRRADLGGEADDCRVPASCHEGFGGQGIAVARKHDYLRERAAGLRHAAKLPGNVGCLPTGDPRGRCRRVGLAKRLGIEEHRAG